MTWQSAASPQPCSSRRRSLTWLINHRVPGQSNQTPARLTKQAFIVDVRIKSFEGSVVATKESSFLTRDIDGHGYGNPFSRP